MFVDNFIYVNEESLSEDLCDDIVELFEKQETGKYAGVTGGGLLKTVKDTVDLIISKNDEKWINIEALLERELSKNVKKYVDNLNKDYIGCNTEQNSNNKFTILKDSVEHRFFMLQKYYANTGKYVYHNDFRVDNDKKSHRVITYIWYLNDVLDGGETDFFNGKLQILPRKGKLVLFPATWTFPHAGKMPKSSDKFIITGWLYNNN